MDIDTILQFVPQVLKWIEGYFPREVQGLVIAFLFVIGICGYFYWNYSKVSVPVKFAAKKYAARKSKVRDVATSLGFVVEEVERDVPQFSKGGPYSLSRKKFPKYTWGKPFGVSSDRWELLCRPGEYSASLGILGWTLVGAPPPAHRRAIDKLIDGLGEPKEILEIEYENRSLSIYWEEKGGFEGLAHIKLVLDLFLDQE